ncbi:MAG TPA: hypothetical protein VFQ61_33985 [Polyangiaceae bacterium]|nr:hypothetical protein [Polyangiaceae bacterium]
MHLRITLALGFLAFACSGGAQTSSPKAAEPATTQSAADPELSRAEGELREAEQQLFGVLRAERETVAADESAPAPALPASPAPAPKAQAEEMKRAKPLEQPPGESGGAAAAEGDGCQFGCRALSSMRRASDAICRITGDADPRCHSARERVRAAEQHLLRSPCTCAKNEGE